METIYIEKLIEEILAFIDQGQLTRATGLVDEALHSNPDHKRLNILKALLLFLTQEFNAALNRVEHVNQVTDSSDQLIVTIAVKIYYGTGKIKKAIDLAKAANEKNPAKAWPRNCLGELMFLQGKYEKAGKCFDDALDLENYNCDAAVNKSKVNIKLGNNVSAIALLEAVLKSRKDANASNLLGLAHYKLKRYKIAEKILTELTDEHPNFVSAIINLANVQHWRGNFSEAEKNYFYANKLNPQNVSVLVNLAKFYINFGKKPEAISQYKAVLNLDPKNHEAILALATLAPDESELLKLETRAEEIIAQENSSDMQKTYATYALAELMKANGNFGKSVEYFNLAGSLNAKIQEFDFDMQKAKFKKIMLDYSKPAQQLKPATEQMRAIFIVGMPRSGTTLLESLLCSHEDVVGFGETDILGDIFENPPYIEKSSQFIQSEQFSKFVRETYFEKIDERYSEYPKFFIDKTPLNFLWLGQIFASFPEASIIHINRDPLATCWSNFSRFFPAKGLSFSNTQESVAYYYSFYLNLMDFWEVKFPGKILNISYEDLSRSPEDSLHRIYKRLGLSWDISMLENRPINNFIGTASSLQVRDTIYPASAKVLEASRPYLSKMTQVMREVGIPKTNTFTWSL